MSQYDDLDDLDFIGGNGVKLYCRDGDGATTGYITSTEGTNGEWQGKAGQVTLTWNPAREPGLTSHNGRLSSPCISLDVFNIRGKWEEKKEKKQNKREE